MAQNLSNKSTNGEIFFVSCVTNNKRFREHIFVLDKPAHVYVKKGTELHVTKKVYAEGTELFITDKKLFVNPLELDLVKCKIGSLACFIQTKYIQKPPTPNGTQHEENDISNINHFIINCGSAINIKLKGDTKIYSDILYAVKVDSKLKAKYSLKFDPKCDIILCKDSAKPDVTGSIFLSHKKEGTESAAQQYGGVSSDAAGTIINSRKTVQHFLKVVSEILDSVDRLRVNVIGRYKDDLLTNLSIFGNEYGKEFSLQHVQAIGQGHPVFKKIAGDNTYELSFTNNISLSGDLSHFSNNYQPVLCARYAAGRTFLYNNITYKNVRIGIFPEGKVSTGAPLIIDL